MKKLVLLVASILLISCILILLHFDGKVAVKKDKSADEVYKHVEYLQCKFYNENDFKKSVLEASGTSIPDASIMGGITPHHLLAANLIASLMKTVSVSKPDLVVVLAPNHKAFGEKHVQSAVFDWQTPYGILKTDVSDVETLVKSGISGLNSDLMQDDHSISGLVPYIKYYMPETKILPILLHGTSSLDESVQLGNTLHQQLKGKKYIVIASIDFSHYLTLKKADLMDEETIKAINSRDLTKISGMRNDNLDSPPTLISFLTLMNTNGANKSKLLFHSNSARIIKINPKETTSYFTIVYY